MAWGQGAGKASWEVRRTPEGGLEAVFTLGDLFVGVTDAGYGQASAEGMMRGTGQPGAPDLPTLSTLVQLPRGSSLAVEEAAGEEVLWDSVFAPGCLLVPVEEPHTKSSPWLGYRPDKAIYAANGWYRGGAPVEAERLGTMGQREVYRLTVRPMAYNPAQGSLRIYRSLKARLKSTQPEAPRLVPPPPERFLIVSRPHYREALQPFVRWKRQEGFEVVEIYAPTHQRDSVKALIHPLFADATPLAPAPGHMLIVGDAADIQSFVGTTQPSGLASHITDLPYAEHTGDMLPDAFLGRWPVSDTAELRVVVDKTLRYEQCLGLDTAALNRVLLVAGKENSSPAPTTTNGQVHYVGHEIKRQHPHIDTLCHRNPASEAEAGAILSEAEAGIGLLNYTAHCTVGGWTSPAVSAGSFDTLAPHQPMLFVNNCCRSNDFGGTCFGEQLLRMPHGGAVGVIGATNETLWKEDYYWAVGPKLPLSLTPAYDAALEGAFDRWAGRHPVVETQGALLQAGNLAVTAFGSPYSAFYWEIYCLLGDPSLRSWLGTPRPVDIAVDEGPSNGQTQLCLRGTPGARVSAMQGGTLLGVATLDSAGQTTLPLVTSLDTLPLLLTATGHNLWTRVDTLAIGPGADPGFALRLVEASDSVVRCRVDNIGTSRFDSLHISLVQTGGDTAAGALIASQTVGVDSLLPGTSQTVTLPVRVLSVGKLSLYQAQLEACTDSLRRSLPVRCGLPAAYPSLTLRLLTPDGAEVRRLMPGSPCLLSAAVEGQYDSLRLEAEALPTGETALADTTALAFRTPDSLCLLRISAEAYLGLWHDRQDFWLVPGPRAEGFEAGTTALPWDLSCRVPWMLDSTTSHSGRFSLRSGPIGHEQTSDLSLHVLLPHDDTISFWAKLSTEPTYDVMTFSVDGARRTPVLFGSMGWTRYSYTLPAGRHTLRWRYSKDASTSHGSDCVWIDDLQLPMAYWEVPVGGQCLSSTLGAALPQDPLAGLRVYPNPARGEVHLEADLPMAVCIMDAVGRPVAQFTLAPGAPAVWVPASLPAGAYLVAGIGEGGQVVHRLLILNN